LECTALVAIGLLALDFAIYHRSETKVMHSAWREKDWLVWYHAHQLYQCDPGNLSEAEIENVRKWCRCVRTLEKYRIRGLDSLSDDECQDTVATLENLCANLEERADLQPFYESCRRRVDNAPD